MSSSCLGKWSNFIWKRELYLFETLVIKSVFSELQGKKALACRRRGEIARAVMIALGEEETELDVRDNIESDGSE